MSAPESKAMPDPDGGASGPSGPRPTTPSSPPLPLPVSPPERDLEQLEADLPSPSSPEPPRQLPSPEPLPDLPSPEVSELPSPEPKLLAHEVELGLPSPPLPSPEGEVPPLDRKPPIAQHHDIPDLPELPDTPSPLDSERHAPEPAYSSLPEVVFSDHMTLPQVVESNDVKVVWPSEPIAMPSENDGLEVAGRRRLFGGLPFGPDGAEDLHGMADDEETLATTTKKTKWIQKRRNRIILALAIVVLVLIIAGIAAGVVAGVVINRGNNGSQQGASSPTGTNTNGGGGTGGGGSGGGGTGGGGDPGGPAPTAPVAPTAPTGPTAPGLPTRTGFGVPTSFPEPIGGAAQQSTCTGTMCPQMLASAQYASGAATTTTFMFARGLDSAIWYRQVDQGQWVGDWKSLGGNFLSQPAAVSMRENRIDVFATSSQGQAIMWKSYQNGVWGDWTSMGGSFGSPPAVCSLFGGNINVIGVDSSHKVMRKNTSDGTSWAPSLSSWESQGGDAGSSVDVACTDGISNGLRIDLVGLGNSGTPPMASKRWSSNSGWDKDWGNAWGLLKGDPTVVSSSDQTLYFGIGLDDAVWHRSWTAAGGWTKEENLGGKFQSSVSAFITGLARVDIFAVGTDSRLKHKARLSGVWSTSWEDLGGYFHSAPKAVVTDVPTGAVTVFGIGPNGTIIHANYEVGAGYNWNPQQWYSDGGAMTASWYRLGAS